MLMSPRFPGRSYLLLVASGIVGGVLTLAACSTEPPSDPGSLELTVVPDSIEVLQGGSGEVVVTITRGGGLTGDVGIGPVPGPSGAGLSIASSSIDAGSSALTLVVSTEPSAQPGTRTIGIEAYHNQIRSAPELLTVEVVRPAGSLTIVASPDPIIVTAGGQAVTSTIGLDRTAPFAGPVALSVVGSPTTYGLTWPKGVTSSISPDLAEGPTSTLSVSASADAINGAYPLQIRGSGEGILNAWAIVWISIRGGAQGFFTFDPSALELIAGGPAATSVLSRDPMVRISGRLSTRMSELPPGITAVFSRADNIASGSLLTVQAEASVAPGTYFLRVDATAYGVDAVSWHAVLPVVVLAAAALH